MPSVFQKFHFYILRIKTSSLIELVHRFREFTAVLKLKKEFTGGKSGVEFSSGDIDFENLNLPELYSRVTQIQVRQILDGRIFTLNTPIEEIRSFEDQCRGQFFNDVRINSRVDIRAVWEPARLQHLMVLMAYTKAWPDCEDAGEIYGFVKSSLLTWVRDNPFASGPHYMSAMECGLRIPVFLYALKHLENLSAEERNLLLRVIHDHARLIFMRLSLYSSLGNHTVCECVGLVMAGALFGHKKEGEKWLKVGITLLEQEARHQILDDGGPAERSINYHRFVLDLYWVALFFLEINEIHDCRNLKQRTRNGEAFLSLLADGEGVLPDMGDNDGGFALAPGVEPPKNRVEIPTNSVTTFNDFGATVIRTKSVVCLFNHGTLGMAPLYNHGHAHALSVLLNVQGFPFLIDPGTYRYNGASQWRQYFKGTRAHNTVCIDGQDQAVQATGFVWTRPYDADLIQRRDDGEHLFLEGMHTGYARVKSPVVHKRQAHCSGGDFIRITDYFEGKGRHRFELNYHFHPDVELEQSQDEWRASSQGRTISVRLESGKKFEMVKGQVEPVFGWFSPAYGVKRPCPVLSCLVEGKADTIRFETLIELNPGGDVEGQA